MYSLQNNYSKLTTETQKQNRGHGCLENIQYINMMFSLLLRT